MHSENREVRKRIAKPASRQSAKKHILERIKRKRIAKPTSTQIAKKEDGTNSLVAKTILKEVRKVYDQSTDGRHKL